MVPSARLELAQLTPLPPQDSVSTNFTTTARLQILPDLAPIDHVWGSGGIVTSEYSDLVLVQLGLVAESLQALPAVGLSYWRALLRFETLLIPSR